jgi:two-component system nitrogen regulation sensor histidine kinase NtrY
VTFRSRMLVAFLIAVLVPLILLVLFVRNEMTRRLTAQYERRVRSLVEVIEEDLDDESDKIAASLAVLRGVVVDDNRFRRAAVDRDRDERRYLLDYAGNAMRLTGLTMLQIQDDSGRIISSGHFRNEYDRLEPRLPALLATAPGGTALVPARAPDEPFLALARVDSFQMGGKRFWIVAGVRVERRFLDRLQRGGDLSVELVPPGGTGPSESVGGTYGDEAIVQELPVPFVDPSLDELATATIRVTHPLDDLQSLRSSVDRWFLATLAVAVVLAVLLVSWLASRISRPLVDLAEKTSRIDLDRLDVDFKTDRRDEIGALSRLLGAMTGRLRASAVRIKDAERRATVGELARQVNHDIKNGLTPIRNVFRHLAQLAGERPQDVPGVFEERRETLDSSITYLENLASNYARLYPRSERRPCDVNEIVERVVTDLRGSRHSAVLRARLSGRPVVPGDPLSIRRVLENLVNNAIDSLGPGGGEVAVSSEVVAGEGGRRARVVVADTGAGMSGEQRARIFDDFYTTKQGGTGLGLSIVRRLVMDLDGSVAVESEPGKGSRFIVEFPLAEANGDSS